MHNDWDVSLQGHYVSGMIHVGDQGTRRLRTFHQPNGLACGDGLGGGRHGGDGAGGGRGGGRIHAGRAVRAQDLPQLAIAARSGVLVRSRVHARRPRKARESATFQQQILL